MEKEKYSNEKIICPYCKEEYDPIDWEGGVYNEEGFEEKCSECEKTFFVTPSCLWSWSTTQDCKLNNEKHNWVVDKELNHCTGNISDDGKLIYKVCQTCGQTSYKPIKKE